MSPNPSLNLRATKGHGLAYDSEHPLTGPLSALYSALLNDDALAGSGERDLDFVAAREFGYRPFGFCIQFQHHDDIACPDEGQILALRGAQAAKAHVAGTFAEWYMQRHVHSRFSLGVPLIDIGVHSAPIVKRRQALRRRF